MTSPLELKASRRRKGLTVAATACAVLGLPGVVLAQATPAAPAPAAPPANGGTTTLPTVPPGVTPAVGQQEVPQPSAVTPPTPLPKGIPDTSVEGVKPGSAKPATLFNGQVPGQPLPGDPKTVMSLEDAIALAFQHNPDVLQAQETVISTGKEVDEIKAIERPQVTGSAYYSRLANPASSVFSGGATPASIPNPFSVGLSITPPGTTPIALSSSTTSTGSSVSTTTGTATASGSTTTATTATTSTAGSSSSAASSTNRSQQVNRQTTTGSGTTTTTTTPTTTGSTTPANSGYYDLNSEAVRLSVSQLIDITGIVRVAEKYGDLQEALSRLELARTRQQTAYNVRNGYYNLLRAEAFVTVDEAAVADSAELLRVTKAQLAAGVAAQFDVLTAQTEYDNNVQALISARNQVALSKNAFANSLGLDPSTTITTQVQPLPAMPVLDEEGLLKSAFLQRPEYVESDVNLLKAGYNIRLSHRNLEPYLNVGVNAGYAPSNTETGEDKTSASIGVALTWPLYDGGATRAAVDVAKSEQRVALVQKDQFVKGIKAEVQQSIIAVNDANQRTGEIAETVTEAKEAVRLAEIRYKAGVGTQLDVNNAEAQLVQAESNQVNAQFDYLGALARLSLAVGTPQ